MKSLTPLDKKANVVKEEQVPLHCGMLQADEGHVVAEEREGTHVAFDSRCQKTPIRAS